MLLPKGFKHSDESRKKMSESQKGHPHHGGGAGKGFNHWNWKGGIKKDVSGYILLYIPGHPMADIKGYVKRSRFIMSETLGRPLVSNELVHHINGIKDDDRPENLKLTHKGKHTTIHKTGEALSSETKRKISDALRGQKRSFSKEHRENLSKASKERWRRERNA